MKTFES